jgi:hypothetical protein
MIIAPIKFLRTESEKIKLPVIKIETSNSSFVHSHE